MNYAAQQAVDLAKKLEVEVNTQIKSCDGAAPPCTVGADAKCLDPGTNSDDCDLTLQRVLEIDNQASSVATFVMGDQNSTRDTRLVSLNSTIRRRHILSEVPHIQRLRWAAIRIL